MLSDLQSAKTHLKTIHNSYVIHKKIFFMFFQTI
jgi:hypothetical protein